MKRERQRRARSDRKVHAGEKYGRLLVLSVDYDLYYEYKPTTARCVCDCGVERIVRIAGLRSGASQSCGCLARENASCTFRRHGESQHGTRRGRATKEYRTWGGIKQRCLNKNTAMYSYYGGRGITMHESWKYDYEQFVADVGRCPPDKRTLDRIDNNGNYEPGNVRWSTHIDQANNTRHNVWLTAFGKTMTLVQWARYANLPYHTLRNRHNGGWTDEQAIASPHGLLRRPPGNELPRMDWQ